VRKASTSFFSVINYYLYIGLASLSNPQSSALCEKEIFLMQRGFLAGWVYKFL
jgi:hypothetical protein